MIPDTQRFEPGLTRPRLRPVGGTVMEVPSRLSERGHAVSHSKDQKPGCAWMRSTVEWCEILWGKRRLSTRLLKVRLPSRDKLTYFE